MSSSMQSIDTRSSPEITKKKTRVADLISRLSSSTASSRAKAEAAKATQLAALASLSSSTETLKAMSPTSSSGARQVSSRTSNGSLNSGTPNKLSAKNNSSLAAKRILSSPGFQNLQKTGKPSTPNNSYKRIGGTGRTSLPPSLPPSAHLPSPHENQFSHFDSPDSPSPSVRTIRNGQLLSGSSPSSSSLQRHVSQPLTKATSRLSLGSTLSSTSHSRVEDLKAKINELEVILQAERVDRETAFNWAEQCRMLEETLQKERQERDYLKAELERVGEEVVDRGSARRRPQSSDAHSGSPDSPELFDISMETAHSPNSNNFRNSINGSSSNKWQQRLSSCSSSGLRYSLLSSSPILSEAETLTDGYSDDMKRVSIIAGQEGTEEGDKDPEQTHLATSLVHSNSPNSSDTSNPQEDITTSQLIQLETQLTMLKANNSCLRRESEATHRLMQEKESKVVDLTGQVESLLEEVQSLKMTLSDHQLQMIETKAKCAGLESSLTNKKGQIESLNEVNSKLNGENDQLKRAQETQKLEMEKVRQELEQIQFENGELKNQLQVFQASRRPLDARLQTLERENRIAQRTIAALRVTLQDLKLSVEEREIENDELNRSIQAVMDQAKETIGGVKRHSLLTSASQSPRSQSPGL